MRTGDVTNINHPQSFIDRGETLNISPINVTITTCPNRITKAIYTKLALNDVLTSRSLLNMLKTEDIHPPKTGISVHFSGSLV